MVDLNIQLPDSFFQEEERWGYLVSAKTKELWAVQLDLLNEFDRVCKKYNLKYILDFGSMLGAVRHKGFIPWDDDLDVSMLREDYEKLLQIAPQEFRYPYFLQNHHSEHTYADTVTKLRRSDTTFLMKVDLGYRKMNHGIFIDIFVYDSLPSDDMGQLAEMIQHVWIINCRRDAIAYVPSCNDSFRTKLRYLYYNLRYGSIYKQYDKLDRFVKQFDSSPYRACILTGMQRFYKEAWFKDTIEMQFENLLMPVSSHYDEMLKLVYGDYMTPVMGGSAHTLVYYDTSRSYLEVMKDKVFMKELRKKCNRFN